MTYRRLILAVPLVLSACQWPDETLTTEAASSYTPGQTAPDTAAPGTCWDKIETPAIVQTVREDVLVQPAQISSTGTVQTPPIYRSQTRDVIIQERKDTWFEIVCPDALTPEFVASVQRALELRGYYAGPITGKIGPLTTLAIRAFQTGNDIAAANPGKLTLEAARKLGLWESARDDS